MLRNTRRMKVVSRFAIDKHNTHIKYFVHNQRIIYTYMCMNTRELVCSVQYRYALVEAHTCLRQSSTSTWRPVRGTSDAEERSSGETLRSSGTLQGTRVRSRRPAARWAAPRGSGWTRAGRCPAARSPRRTRLPQPAALYEHISVQNGIGDYSLSVAEIRVNV